MSFDILEYIGLINNNKHDEASDLKNKSVPNKIYRFVSLSDKHANENEKMLDDRKLSNLKNNQIWLSKHKTFNDPFDTKSFIASTSEYAPVEQVKFKDNIRMACNIGCFTDEIEENIPMWAHYANQHKGFCIEYEVINKELIYPVYYTDSRIETVIFEDLVKELLYKKIYSDDTESEKRLKRMQSIINISFCIKHESWKYENEYRLFYNEFTKYISKIEENKNGVLVKLEDVGLKIKSIYTGLNCNGHDKRKFKTICKNLNIDMYEAKIKENSTSYSLYFEKSEL